MNRLHRTLARRLVAGFTALGFFFSGVVGAAPDGSFSTAEKAKIKAEIARVAKLNQQSCQPVIGSLKSLEYRLTGYDRSLKEYVAAYQDQRKLVLDLLKPFVPADVLAKAAGQDAAQGQAGVMDDYNALVKDAKKTRLFTETAPMAGDKPGESADWVWELNYAWEGWRDRGKKSPDTQDKRYFFEGPEALAGNYKASLGPLAQKRKALQEAQGKIHDRYREALQNLRKQITGSLIARDMALSQAVNSERRHLDDLRANTIPALVKEIEAQANSGQFEHCYGFTPAEAAKRVPELPWVLMAGKLTPIPALEPTPLPNPDKLPQALPRVLLKADGVEHYLRTQKMFADQAKLDFEASKLSLLNVVEGTWDVLSSTAVHIYKTGEFLVKAGIKVGDVALADLQAIVNLGAYGVGIESAAFWDPAGAIARNKEWTGKVAKAVSNTYVEVKDVCAKLPPEQCAAAAVLLPLLKPTLIAMGKVGEAMPAIGEKMESMGTALFLTQDKLNEAQSLTDFQYVRDQAAKMEQGAADLRNAVGVIAGEVVMNLALGAGIARMSVEGGGSLTGAQAKALFEAYQEAGKGAQTALSRLGSAADKLDDIARAAARGDLTAAQAREQMARLTEILRQNRLDYELSVRRLPPEAREALDKTFARGVEDLKTRMDTALRDGKFDDLVHGQTEVLSGKSTLPGAKTEIVGGPSASRTLSEVEVLQLEQARTSLLAKSATGTLSADDLAQLEKMRSQLLSASKTLSPDELAILEKYRTELIAASPSKTLGPSELARLEKMETELLGSGASARLTPAELTVLEQQRSQLRAAASSNTHGPSELAKLEQLRVDMLAQRSGSAVGDSFFVEAAQSKANLAAQAAANPLSSVSRPVVDEQAVSLFKQFAEHPPNMASGTAGESLNLSLKSGSGQFQVGKHLGEGGFKDVFMLTDAAGQDTGKVIAFLRSQRGSLDEFKSFLGSELYSKSVLDNATGLAHVGTGEIVRLPDGRWAMVMDNFSRQGITVGRSLADDAFAGSLRGKLLSDPALRADVEAFAHAKGKLPAALSQDEIRQLAAEMAGKAEMEKYVDELMAMPLHAGLSRAEVIAKYNVQPIIPKDLKAVAEYTQAKLGLAYELPKEAQEAAFKYLIRSAKQGISQLDFKPGNIGFRQGQEGLEAVLTDMGGAYGMSDDVASQFVGKLGEGVVRERQRMQAVLKQVVATGEADSPLLAVANSNLSTMPLTAGASRQTLQGKYFESLKRLAENPEADISDLLGSAMNQYVRSEFAGIGASNPVLSKLGHGMEPGNYVGRKGLEAVDRVPAEADQFLAAREASKTPAKADVAKAKEAQDALKRAEEQKAAAQMEEANSQDTILEGMCTRLQSRILGGSTVLDIEDAAGRGIGCDMDKLKQLIAPDAPTQRGSWLALPWKFAANQSVFLPRRAA